MTIKEIKEMQELLKDSPEKLSECLKNQLLIKENKNGIKKIKIKVIVDNGLVEETRKAFILSDNLCLLKFGKNEIEDFKSFAGKLSLTHIKTGMKVATVKINKGDALKLAKEMEKMADLNFKTSEEWMKKTTQEQRKQVFDLCFKYIS